MAKRANSVLAGQTELAQKVFAVVPLDEPWDVQRIHKAMKDAGLSGAHLQAVHGCLGQLRDASLVRETRVQNRDQYQRSAMLNVTPRKPQAEKPAKAPRQRVLRSADSADVQTTTAALMLQGAVATGGEQVEDFQTALAEFDQGIEGAGLAVAVNQLGDSPKLSLAFLNATAAVESAIGVPLEKVATAPVQPESISQIFTIQDPTTMSATDQMIDIASEMNALQVEFAQRMDHLKSRMEEASLQFMHELEQNAHAAERLAKITDFLGGKV